MNNRSMKILHILDHFLPYHSGYTYRSLSVFKNLREKGLKQIIITSAKHKKFEQEKENIEGFPIYHTQFQSKSMISLPFIKECYEMWALYKRINFVFKQTNFDIIHSHSPILNAIPALIFSKLNKIPILYDIRAFWEDAAVSHGNRSEKSFDYKLIRALEGLIAKKVDKVSVICNGLMEDLIRRGVTKNKISIQSNGLDLINKEIISENYEKRLNHIFTIGYIGSFYKYEGLDILLDAMKELNDPDREYKLILVGGNEEENNLKRKVEQLKLFDKVIFTGPIAHAEVSKYYSKMDLLVYPRKKQRLTELVTPLKPLEAMSYGKVILASDVGGHKELIQDRITGILFKADDTNDLIKKIKDIANQKYDIKKIKNNAIHNVNINKNWSTIVEGYIDIYSQLMIGLHKTSF